MRITARLVLGTIILAIAVILAIWILAFGTGATNPINVLAWIDLLIIAGFIILPDFFDRV